jgi:hypothetical protein
MTATATTAAWQSVIDHYVTTVRAADREGEVVTATFNEPRKVILELRAVSWALGLRSDSESEATLDAWWDAFVEMLPYIAQALR